MTDIKQYEPLWGSWYVDELIGEGSFGKVYKCRKEEFSRTYYSAVKIISIPQNDADLRQIRGEGMDEESARSYFQAFVSDIIQEIDLMSAFRGNSNVVSFEDHKVIERTDKLGWDILIRMELLTSLTDHANDKPLSQDDVVKLGIHICRALELCALKKTIHRDIKPDNIFVSEYGEYKLGDFGIARQIERTMSGLSKKGTYTYMAPEVFKGDDYGASVDTYSLGIVLYRYLNGGRTPLLPNFPTPITPRDRDDALQRRMRGEVLPPIDNVNPSLNAIVLKACAFDRSARFANSTEMREALEAIAGGGTSYAPKVIEKPRPEVYEQAPTESTVGLFAEQSKTEATVGVFAQAPVNEPNETTSKTDSVWDSKPPQMQAQLSPIAPPSRRSKWKAFAGWEVVVGWLVIVALVGIVIIIAAVNRAPESGQNIQTQMQFWEKAINESSLTVVTDNIGNIIVDESEVVNVNVGGYGDNPSIYIHLTEQGISQIQATLQTNTDFFFIISLDGIPFASASSENFADGYLWFEYSEQGHFLSNSK